MKKPGGGVIAIVVTAVAVVVIMCIVKYNKIAALDEGLENAWAPLVDVLQKRYDEIPKLVNEVILYAGQEDGDTRALAAAHKKFAEAESMSQKVKASNEIETALEREFLQAAERYAGISSHFQYMTLKQGFDSSEKEMQGPMKRYNEAVSAYDTYVRLFPNDLVALLLGFGSKATYFGRGE